MDNPDHDAIVREAVSGRSLRDIARAHDLTLVEVREIIDEEAALAFNGSQLRREWLLEARRLRELGQRYYDKAMGVGAEAANSAVIFIKASERLATLTGMNAPTGHAVQIIHGANLPNEQTSTQHVRSLLDTILHISPRERELLDKRELDGDTSPQTLDEINQLRAARGKLPVGGTSNNLA